MKLTKFITAIIGSTCFALAAHAADLPSRKAPAPSYLAPISVYSWSGLYAGVQLGYARQRVVQREFDLLAGGLSTDSMWAWNGGGFVGGGHLGYNAQLDRAVLGLEGDIEGASVKSSQTYFDPFVAGVFQSWGVRNNWRGSARARIGYSFDRLLPYITGGLAFGGFKSNLNNIGTASEQYSTTRIGWTLGAGLEYALADAWSVRAEYRYTDFGQFSQSSWLAFPGSRYQTRVTDHSVRLGLSYHFNSQPSRVVAKY